MYYYHLIVSILLASTISHGFMFNFQQEHREQPEESYEDKVLNNNCGDYLCPDTMACVKSYKDCPCPFPKSQLRCRLPNKNYVCISKPATHDERLNAIYDDPQKSSKTGFQGHRDCGWVLKAYEGSM